MNILVNGFIIIAAGCVALAVVQAMIWVRRRDEVSHLIFAGATLAAAGVAVGEARMSQATSVDALVTAFGFTNYFIAGMLIGLTWFIVSYTNAKPGALAWIATLGWLGTLVLNFVRKSEDSLDQLAELQYLTTPWGERYAVPPPAPFDLGVLVSDIATVAVVLFAAQQALRTYRAGRKGQAILSGTIAVFLLLALIQATLVDLGILSSPYLIGYLFLAVVVVTNYQLAADVAHASVLSEEGRSNELRWQSLTQGAGLLVLRTDPDGVVAETNSCFSEISGFSAEQVVGRHHLQVFAEGDRDRVDERFESILAGQQEERFEAQLLTSDGNSRTIAWRSALVEDSEGKAVEVLRIGADQTSRLHAESDRDAAYVEIVDLKSRLEEENLYLKEEIRSRSGDTSQIVGTSEVLSYVMYRMEQVAPTDITVLIQGETGVGKELIARALHENSGRSKGTLVRVNCAALPANLVESELFGHVAGAFTDARKPRAGRFDLASGGTLFLDEVSELPREIQPKLLRVLQEGEFEPVGSSVTRKANFRLVAATNRNLQEEVKAGRFREDLFYRLHVYPITVPPLRDRRDDIPLLVEHFLPQISADCGRDIREVPAGVLRVLTEYSWPGNIRQLHNVLQEAVVASNDSVLRLVTPLESVDGHSNIAKSLAEIESEHICTVLESTGGQVAGPGGAAEILGLHPNTLRSRMKKLGLSVQDLGLRTG